MGPNTGDGELESMFREEYPHEELTVEKPKNKNKMVEFCTNVSMGVVLTVIVVVVGALLAKFLIFMFG